MNLYKCTFKVRPDPKHPLYWDVQFGYLTMWILADSEEDAAFRCSEITKHLPYELVGSKLKIQNGDTHPNPDLQRLANEAKKLGFSLHLAACKTGVDEDGFENEWE